MKTTIDMAREAGLFTHKEVQPEIRAFAELVRADAIAAIEGLERSGIWITREEAIAAIRARGQA